MWTTFCQTYKYCGCYTYTYIVQFLKYFLYVCALIYNNALLILVLSHLHIHLCMYIKIYNIENAIYIELDILLKIIKFV